MAIPTAELHSLKPSTLLQMFVIDASAIGGSVYRLHDGTSGLLENIVWQGYEYTRFAIRASGFEQSTKGTIPRPKLSVSAADGMMGALIRDLGDLVGAVVTRKRCFAKHLDGMPAADPTAHLEDDVWEVNRKISESVEGIVFELVSPFDTEGAKIPGRIMTARFCNWRADQTDVCSFLETCSRRYSACKENYPDSITGIPYGGFIGLRGTT